MSLVAYASSDDSDNEEDNALSQCNYNMADFEGDVTDNKSAAVSGELIEPLNSTLNLPLPKSLPDTITLQHLFEKLPEPKTQVDLIEEEDDEFLRKKAVPVETVKPKSISGTKNLVRIEIPSLKDFEDVEEKKKKSTDIPRKLSCFSSLISILPDPKADKNFIKSKQSPHGIISNETSKSMTLIPDTVRTQRSARNIENIDKIGLSNKAVLKPKISIISVSDSEGSDDENCDFFALTHCDKLPTVSKDEIAAMVSKKAAQMANSSSKFLALTNTETLKPEEKSESASSINQTTLDKNAIEALVSGREKRRKIDSIKIIDIDNDQLRPNKNEWLRTALASATTYQPTGVLTDEEPAAGTRRKHQITYLAHKAKANEAELQAMWSANRQSRRQTQNKYGF